MNAHCKTLCGRDLTNAKERRPLNGKQYNALFTIASAAWPSAPAQSIHTVLAQSPSYVCKSCHSVLTKYSSITKEVTDIQKCMKNMLEASQSSSVVSSILSSS